MLPLVALILVVHDTVGLADPEMAGARSTVNAILEQAFLEIDWHVCPAPNVAADTGDPLCASAPRDGVVFVRIVRATGLVSPETLGEALVDGTKGYLATVFSDHVRSLAAVARFDPGVLLGRAMAHEIGHLLMGTRAHPSTGLMRGRWTVDELQRDLAVDWTWACQEIILIAQGMDARTRRIE
jgi:hypothetical protein